MNKPEKPEQVAHGGWRHQDTELIRLSRSLYKWPCCVVPSGMGCARRDAEFRALGILLALALVAGTLFYCQLEGWTLIDSLYFCVMTLSTIGYGDLAPTSEISKVFTIVIALLGISLFASFVAKLVAHRLDAHAERRETHKNRSPERGGTTHFNHL